jgi:PKD repeat protein
MDKKIRNIIAIIVALTFFIPGSVFALGGTNTTVSINPTIQMVEKGETFTVSIYVEPSEPIMGASFDFLYYNADLIHANSVTESDLFDDYEMFNDGTIDNNAGVITDVFLVALSSDAVSNPRSFVDIEFTAQQQLGISTLNLEGVIITNKTGIELPLNVIDGNVNIEESSSIVWSTALHFIESSGKRDYAVFGESPNANDSGEPDSYDAPKAPPPMPPYIYAWFDDGFPEPYHELFKDYRRYPNTEKTWDLYVKWKSDSSDFINVTISWDNSFTDCEYDSIILMRYDPFNEIWEFAIDMLLNDNYIYTPRYLGNEEDGEWLTDYFQINATNNPPNTPSNPSPEDGATGVDINTDLSWHGDAVTYDIYLGIETPPPKIVSKQTSTFFNPGALSYDTTYYWKIVAWDDYEQSTIGPIWEFTTKEQTDGNGGGGSNGGSGGNGGPSPPEPNESPIADASASEAFGFINALLLFDGSLSNDTDGYITSWQWDFGDNTTGDGEIIKHSYTDSGVYTVILTVTDDNDATDADIITVQIDIANTAPKKPSVDGITKGHQNTEYIYNARSTDLDDDTICYIFDWGDNTNKTSEFLPSGSTCAINHKWSSGGRYLVSVTAYDNKTHSESTQLIILIDIYYVGEIGYLIDIDGDEIYDSFYSNTTEEETDVEDQDNGTYLIDDDGDGEWEYTFDLVNLAEYKTEKNKGTPGFEFILIISVIIVVAFWKRKKEKQ